MAGMASARIHQANDQASAEVMAGRLRAAGIPVEVVRADAGPPYGGLGLSTAYDLLVPAHLDRRARRALGIRAEDRPEDRRGTVAVLVFAGPALVVALLGLLQRLG
jgi:hypothetical protein